MGSRYRINQCFKYPIFIFVLSIGIAINLRAAGAESTITYYVAKDGRDVWSGTIAEPNADSTDGPFSTILRARDAIRTLKQNGEFRKSVEVVVREGKYHLEEPIILRPEDSGTASKLITYRAAEGEQVILSGGKQVSGEWQTDGGNIHYLDIPEAADKQWKFRQLFVNGRREIRARYPNYNPNNILTDGWLYAGEGGGFGVILAGLAIQGDFIEYEFTIPEAGNYYLWTGYATTIGSMNEKLSLKIDSENIPLRNMPSSGGWRDVEWTIVAQVYLEAGDHVMRWENISPEDQRIHFDAFVFNQQDAAHTFLPRTVIQAEVNYTGSSSVLPFQVFGGDVTKVDITLQNEPIHPEWANAPDARINIFAEEGWYNERVGIESIDMGTSTITISGQEAQGDIRSGNRFYVYNILEELDSPREWYLDYSAGRLYYWPEEETPDSLKIIAPVVGKIFYLKGDIDEGSSVSYINIEDFHLRHTDYVPGHPAVRTATDGTVLLENAHNIAIEGNKFRNIGGYGIWLHLDSYDNFISDNEISEAGAGGVLLTAAELSWGNKYLTRHPAAQNVAPYRNTISKNHIHHSGRIYKYVSGVHLDSRPESMQQFEGNLISENHIHHMPRLGIFAFQNQGGNSYIRNTIHDVCIESDDGGGIHTATRDPNSLNRFPSDAASPSLVEGNRIYNVYGNKVYPDKVRREKGFGIYLDVRSSNHTVRGNTVYNTSRGAVFVHGGYKNLIEDNIFMNDVNRQVYFMGNKSDVMVENQFVRNYVYTESSDPQFFYITPYSSDVLDEIDYNTYWYGGKTVSIATDRGTFSWNQWQNMGYDQNSVVSSSPPDTAVGNGEEQSMPGRISLRQNYPNPFNSSTSIRFVLPATEEVHLAVYDLKGHKVKTLIRGIKGAGLHQVHWTGKDALGKYVSSGVYIYRLDVSAKSFSRKLVYLK